jgi:hypothetical protein
MSNLVDAVNSWNFSLPNEKGQLLVGLTGGGTPSGPAWRRSVELFEERTDFEVAGGEGAGAWKGRRKGLHSDDTDIQPCRVEWRKITVFNSFAFRNSTRSFFMHSTHYLPLNHPRIGIQGGSR